MAIYISSGVLDGVIDTVAGIALASSLIDSIIIFGENDARVLFRVV